MYQRGVRRTNVRRYRDDGLGFQMVERGSADGMAETQPPRRSPAFASS